MIPALVAWGESQTDVRAMVLTSTRAIEGAPVDRFSDYDVIVISADIRARYDDQSWIQVFGDVIIDWWDPLEIDHDTGVLTTGNIVYYSGTLKIDFTLWPPEMAGMIGQQLPAELDAGYRVLLDKDGLTQSWPDASGTGYKTKLPDCNRYLETINSFFIGVPYVVTALLRGELLPAKWVLDYDMRYEYLLPMMKWYAVSIHGDNAHIGNLGKGVQRFLPEETTQRLTSTYAGFEVESNRLALTEMINLFRDIAQHVGEAIGCEYPTDLHDRVMHHIRELESA